MASWPAAAGLTVKVGRSAGGGAAAAWVDEQVGEGGDAGAGGDRGGALEGAGARVDRRGDGGAVAGGEVAVGVAELDGGLGRERGACGRAGGIGRDHELAGGGRADG